MRRGFLAALLAVGLGLVSAANAAAYQNFRASIYVVVNSTKMLADKAVFDAQYARVSRQLKFDKVYIEVYRDHMFASDAEIEKVKSYFAAKGITVAGGITLAAGGKGGQFGTFDYEDAADRAECQKASELAARHFGEVILDDFFFYTSKSDADIAAKGARSWTQYRLDTMRDVAAHLVVGPAHAVNPSVKMVIKYPNWYEHFQGLGYDLEKEPQIFDGIYTGTETRESQLTDQYLQPYESYEIIRYYNAIRPGGNGGGWVDTGSLKNVDRYIEQLQDTLLAKAPEVTLFNWIDMAGPLAQFHHRSGPVVSAAQDWVNQDQRKAALRGYHGAGKDDPGPGWAQVAGFAFDQVDAVLGQLGGPVGLISYKPYQSYGEDFLQHYLGMIGLPIEMTPHFPGGVTPVLLTESAAHDPDIVAKIKAHLGRGGSVIITSGFLQAMQNKGFKDVVEWEVTGRVAAVGDFVDGFGAGNGTSLNDAGPAVPVLLPEVRFYTNDSWAILRGTAGDKGYPVLITNHYSKGTITLLTVPENPADLYRLPQGLLNRLRAYLMPEALRLEAPARVSLFAYDNDTAVVQSFRDGKTAVRLVVPGNVRALRDLSTGAVITGTAGPARDHWQDHNNHTIFAFDIGPRRWRALRIEK